MDHSCTEAKKAGLYSQYRRQQKIKCKLHGGGMEKFAPNVQNITEKTSRQRGGFDARLGEAVPSLLVPRDSAFALF